MALIDDMTAAHPIIGPLMVEALACLCERVAQIPNPPMHCCFRIGQEVIHDMGYSIDQCCEGIAYVMLGDFYPSAESFPEQDIVRQASNPCSIPSWGLILKFGIIRCIDVGGVNPTSCDSWNEMAVQNLWDTKALLRTSCCVRDYVQTSGSQLVGMSSVIDRQTQGNPLGGCVERYVTMTIQIPNCDC